MFGYDGSETDQQIMDLKEKVVLLQSLVDKFIEVYGNQQHCTGVPCTCDFCVLNRDMAKASTPGTKFNNPRFAGGGYHIYKPDTSAK